jgi:hypothetical protein
MTESNENRRLLVFDIGLPLALVVALVVVTVVDIATTEVYKPVIDVVFIMDEGAGFAESASQMKANWGKVARSLTEQESDCRFAVLPCQESSEQIPRIAFTSSVKKLKRRLHETAPESGELANEWPETDCLQGLEDAMDFKFRKGAIPIVILATNSMLEDDDRLSKIAKKYKKRGITVMIQAHESEQDFFRPLYRNGGQFFTLAGENKTGPSAAKDDEEDKGDKAAAKVGSLLSGGSNPGADGGPKVEKLIAGVKVKGQLALICDISGSMGRDFPPLVKELREKFPKDTPLVLVVGCAFRPPNVADQRPVKLTPVTGRTTIYGVDFSKDRYVYVCPNTTDAVLLSIRYFRRDTVMFNNDLQDGGSQKAIQAFETLWKRRAFTLSGRSLNCDAPNVLKGFIKKSGGDFKVDPIARTVLPARVWGP